MAENTVTTNGKGDKLLDVFDIVETPTKWGGVYDACGKCGAELRTCHIGQDARDKMTAELNKTVFNPLGLLAGLLVSVKEEDDHEVGVSDVGYLLGLTLHGARKELEIQQMGGGGAYWLHQLVEGWSEEKKEGAS